eukprot:2718760-Pyramimonas_sp.AAC.1
MPTSTLGRARPAQAANAMFSAKARADWTVRLNVGAQSGAKRARCFAIRHHGRLAALYRPRARGFGPPCPS